MRLSLIYEAGEMSRRGFLKLLGKGAAASMAPPESVLKGVEQLATGLSKPIYYSVYYGGAGGGKSVDKLIHKAFGAFNFLKKLGIKDVSANSLTDYLEGQIDPVLFARLTAGAKKSEQGHYAIDTGDFFMTLHPPSSSWYEHHTPEYKAEKDQRRKSGSMEDIPISGKEQLLKVVVDHINNSVDRGWQYEISEKMADWLAERGLKINPTSRYTFEDLPEGIQNHIRNMTPEEKDELPEDWQPPEYREEKRKRQEEEEEKRKNRGAHHSREVGYEKQSMFDPQSSRPAQALGPFESRLRDILKTL